MTDAPGRATRREFPRLIAITALARVGAAETLERFERLAAAARPGTVMLQLRDREWSARERLELGRGLAALCRRTGQLFQVNDRLDLAVLLTADAVHLAEESVETADARRMLGEGVLITRACHEIARVTEVDADGVVLSPILAARHGRPPLGVALLQKARAALDGVRGGSGRLIALGGVDAAGVAVCFGAGSDAVAMVGAGLSVSAEDLVAAVGIARD